ncbi:MAG TPA: succinate dehydrogenase assembly factor 2 [Mesorhizobium sp.]|jgi:antitoxin CptB
MTGTKRSSEGLEPRRAKLLFRSWHRGMREMDLILGQFADAEIAALTDAEIDQYEQLLDIPDTEFLPWVTGERPVPTGLDSPLLQKILASRRSMTF